MKIPALSKYIFRIHISAKHPYLKQHRVNNYAVLPGAASLKIAFDFSRKIVPFMEFNCIEEVFWLSPIVSYGNDVEVLLFLAENKTAIEYSFRNHDGSVVYASGIIKNDSVNYSNFINEDMVSALLKDRSLKMITHDDAYEEFSNIGINYGPFFQSVNKVMVKDNYGVSEISCKVGSLEFVNLLDGSFQSGMAISKGNNLPNLMPISLGRLIINKNLNINQNGIYTVFTEKINSFRTNIVILDENMRKIMSIFDLGIRSGLKH